MATKAGLPYIRTIDTAILRIIAFLHVCNGLYLIGPWYIRTNPEGDASPVYSLFNSHWSVVVFGILIMVSGFLLWYSVGPRNKSDKFLSNTLIVGFGLRLYSLVGVLLTIKSFLPPSYLSQAAAIAVLGAYWLWVKYLVERPTQ